MEKLFKQLEDWVTRSRNKLDKDAFLKARIRLTLIYTSVAAFILSIFSYLLYGSLVAQLYDSIQDKIFDPHLRRVFLNRAQDIIQSRIIFDDIVLLICVLVFGFIITKWTLKPIKESMDKQKRFIADASHELRTPIAILKTQVEVAMRRKQISNIESQEILRDVLDEVNVLSNLANNLLNISKQTPDVSKNKFSKISLNKILNDSILKMNVIAEEKKIILVNNTIKDEKYVKGDTVMLTQLLFNVLNNSINYTSVGGVVTISNKIKNNNVIINIEDTGKGISSDKLPHIFEPFYRSLDSDTNQDGAGLGLTIAKSIVDAHNGDISIKSEINKGTNVEIVLPLSS